MANKSSENKKNKKDIKDISKYDEFELSLLNLQVKIILIYMISDLFLASGTFESLNLCCSKKDVDNNPIILLLEGQYLALLASILIFYVSFSRYDELRDRYENGEINKSIEPENLIRQASVLTVILYKLETIGYGKLYKASLTINVFKCDKKDIEILYLQAACFIMRFYGDYFLLRSTLKSINLIKSKYDKRIKKIENPDEDAVIAAEIYVIQRGVLYDIGYNELLDFINNSSNLENELLLVVKQIFVIANTFGVVGNIISLIGIIKIYNRNLNEPIFGR